MSCPPGPSAAPANVDDARDPMLASPADRPYGDDADVLGQTVPDGFEDAERAVLVRADGNVSAAARALGISRATMHRKLGPRAD